MIVTDLSKSFNPVPKNGRIVDKKILKDKKVNVNFEEKQNEQKSIIRSQKAVEKIIQNKI